MNYDSLTRRDHDDNGDAIYSKVVRAGKRTYFFDVKATRANDYFVTITESRKRVNEDGSTSFARNQMHLDKEDFAKFTAGLNDIVEYVKEHKPDYFTQEK
jgi:hypothetical protein